MDKMYTQLSQVIKEECNNSINLCIKKYNVVKKLSHIFVDWMWTIIMVKLNN